MATTKNISKAANTSFPKYHEVESVQLKSSIHRRILTFLNEATRPQDLMYEKVYTHDEGNPIHEDNPEDLNIRPRRILDHAIAENILELRDKEYPFGFRNLRDLIVLELFDRRHLDILLSHFGPTMYGQYPLHNRWARAGWC